MATVWRAFAVLCMAILLGAWMFQPPAVQVLPDQSAFHYQGRWHQGEDGREADWPCTAVTFDVQATEAIRFKVMWSASGPSRFNLTVGNFSKVQMSLIPWKLESSEVEIPSAGRFTVELRKLSGSHPFGTGRLESYLPARWVFYGLDKVPNDIKLLRPVRPKRRIEFVGSGDTAGFAVDASDSSFLSAWLWQTTTQSCQAAYPGVVAEQLDAEYQVQALVGVGVVQNAHHHVSQHLFGEKTWLHYWPSPMASKLRSGTSRGQAQTPQLVVVHMGSDDFHQQGGALPSKNTFRVLYSKLLRSIINTYGSFSRSPAILALCGGRGSSPESDACSTCPIVEEAVQFFYDTLDLHADNASVRMEYFFLPCFAAGSSSIVSLGALDRHEHHKLATKITTKIRSFMEW